MCSKILAIVFILIAIILAILGITLPPDHIDWVITISKFFDIMLPILAVGALLKYLCPCPTHGYTCPTRKDEIENQPNP